MIINESAGSGGDALPYYFKQQKIGPLIGTRTWGAPGRDPEIERAVQEAIKLLEKTPLKRVPRPAPIDRTRKPGL